MEQLLCYWPDPSDPRRSAVGRAALPLKLRLRAAAPGQTGQTLGFLLGRKGFEEAEGSAPPVDDPILVLDGFTGSRLDALLKALARARIPKSVFKAVVTADNVNWTLAQLWEELKKEREAIEQGRTAEHDT